MYRRYYTEEMQMKFLLYVFVTTKKIKKKLKIVMKRNIYNVFIIQARSRKVEENVAYNRK